MRFLAADTRVVSYFVATVFEGLGSRCNDREVPVT
jgi:hypothetical protein